VQKIINNGLQSYLIHEKIFSLAGTFVPAGDFPSSILVELVSA